MSKVFIALLFLGIVQTAAPQDTVPQKDLVQYVRDAKKAGLNDKQIQQNAVGAGWPAPAVADAIAYATAAPNPTAKPVIRDKQPETSTSDGEVKKSEDTPGNAGSPGSSAPAAGVPLPGAGGAPATAGVADSSIKPNQSTNRSVPDDYQIGAGDVLHVNVWGEPTASVNSTVVRPDGKISMPLIHEISVVGMTTAQAEKAIAEQLGRFLNNPDVAVIVGGINSKKIYTSGQVKKEGTIPYTYRMTVMQAISEAGGLTPYAKKKKIYVLRNEDGHQYKIAFDYDAVLRGEHMEMNIPLKPGDQIIVP